jgi:hypothetical protein
MKPAASLMLRELWRRGIDLAREAARWLRTIPRWTERCLDKGGLSVAYRMASSALTCAEQAAVAATQMRIDAKRRLRVARNMSAPPLSARQIRFRKFGIGLVAMVPASRTGVMY